MKTIPKTNGRYSLDQDGRVINNKTGREVTPFRPGTVKIQVGGKRTSVTISKIEAMTRDVKENEKTDEERFIELEAQLKDTLGQIKKLFLKKGNNADLAL